MVIKRLKDVIRSIEDFMFVNLWMKNFWVMYVSVEIFMVLYKKIFSMVVREEKERFRFDRGSMERK